MDDDRDDNQRRSAGAPDAAGDALDLWHDEHLRVDALSAYHDEPDTFAPAIRAAIDDHLADCTDCAAALDDLRSLVAGLEALPEPVVPRSFALTPALLAERDVPAPLDARRLSPRRERQMMFVAWASAIAAVLLVVVLGADAISGSTDTDSSAALVAAEPASARSFSVETAPPEDAADLAATVTGGAPESAGAAAPQPTEANVSAPEATTSSSSGVVAQTPPATEPGTENTLSAPSAELASVVVATDDEDDHWGWGTLELALGLLLTWLLAASFVLPRLASSGKAGN
jgi:hypothetical protein